VEIFHSRSVASGLAFFGTILVYLVAQECGRRPAGDVVGSAGEERPDARPQAVVARFRVSAGRVRHQGRFAPFHAWLPDAHAEGPTPISAVLSGLLLNVALYALLRFKMVLAGNASAIDSAPSMVGLGLVSLVFAAFMLYRRRDIKRLFAYSRSSTMGIAAFAFGMGGPLANFAGLLHMTMHSLIKSGIFFSVGHIAQVKAPNASPPSAASP